MKNILNYFKKDPEGHFEQGASLNDETKKRNWLFVGVIAVLLMVLGLGYEFFTKKSKKPTAVTQPIDFGAVIDSDFTEKDNQSALSAQQAILNEQQKKIDSLTKTIESLRLNNTSIKQDLKRDSDKMLAKMNALIATFQQTSIATIDNTTTSAQADNSTSSEEFGAPKLPPRASVSTRYQSDGYSNDELNVSIPASNAGIDTFELTWTSTQDSEPYKRTVDNYVPAGSFVTAVVTGGADANAGVNGQSDTAPIVFQTLNDGTLPNGAASRLKNCTIIGAVYGEISSSRGIVRTQRLSCIFDDEIIDLSVEGTVFNYGRNGIRGTTILKNGKIVQMAGVAGILTGLGETGKALSQTTSTSALGTTSTINSSDALMNLAGSATASVGSKLADYYINLAEQYHPIIELNPGNVVNIVFLKGFPLDAVGIEEYETSQSQVAPDNAGVAQILNTVTNPLLNQLPSNIKPTQEDFNNTSQSAPQLSAFGVAH
ncbi:TrbI/VirB10 family protein [uncultured Shewanella sp.]|uniref:TrbI/VirB10 family protein n=1 Tax=uncultured Shewanella sp. TaxID=173975 RepID=UPI00261ECBFE|nr:TrbI/VirB10 family protein [uncultured Shewanella sp.]